MKSLYLLRHAKAGWNNAGLGDSQRTLSPRGLKDAADLGRVLAGRELHLGGVFSSTAVRNRETLELILPQIDFPVDEIRFDRLLYLAPGEILISFILGLANNLDRVLICGHNPGLEEAGAYFLGSDAERFSSGSLLEIQFDIPSWSRAGPARAKKKMFLTPRMLDVRRR